MRLISFACLICAFSMLISVCLCLVLRKQNNELHLISSRLELLSRERSNSLETIPTGTPTDRDVVEAPSTPERMVIHKEHVGAGRWGRKFSSPSLKEKHSTQSERKHRQADRSGRSAGVQLFASEPRR